MGLKTIKTLVVLLLLSTSALSENQCYYKTETISENGHVVSVKEIKICEETVPVGGNSFWQKLAYTTEGQKMFWDTVIFIFTLSQ